MVSSHILALSKSRMGKSFSNELLFPLNSTDIVPSDHIELDFSDVFGPLPSQSATESNFATERTELMYDDPVSIHSRSHSFVGPSTFVCQSLKLSMLTLHEEDDTIELLESVNNLGIEVLEKKSTDIDVQKPLENVSLLKDESVGLGEFEVMKVVGEGAFGRVYQVRKRGSSEIYAMKVIRKDKIMEKNHAEYMKAERDILTKIDHPFIVQLRYSFQAMLTDFGLAKEFNENTRSNSMCGTIEYMSPEIVLGRGHDKAADWWSVGILLFEMLTGKPPFTGGGNRGKIKQKIIKDKLKLPSFLSSEAHGLLKGLLQKEANKRMGNGPMGGEEIKRHKWFKPINWKKLEGREIEPSFRPEVAGKHCIANFETRWTDMSILDSPASSPNAVNSNIFQGFTYVRPAAPFLKRNSPPN